MQKLSKSADSVQKVIDALQLTCKVIELEESTRTAADAALTIGCMVGQIVKSLIFKTNNTNQAVLVLVSGKNQVDIEQITVHVGENIVKANADFVKKITGFTIGGIPPFGHKHIINLLYFDQDLLLFEKVWAAAGTPNAVFSINTKDLAMITGAKVIKVKDELL